MNSNQALSGRVWLVVTALVVLLGAGSVVGDAASATEETVTIDGLQWALETNGDYIRWPDAVAYCNDLTLSGQDDWRLPTMAELGDLHDADAEYGIRQPFKTDACCLWSGESLVDRMAEDGDTIGGSPEMYHWGYMFDGGLEYYAVHIFDDGQALCVRDVDYQ